MVVNIACAGLRLASGAVGLTTDDYFDLEISRGHPVDGFAQLGYAPLVCEVACVDEDVAGWKFEAGFRWGVAVGIRDTDKARLATHFSIVE